MSPVHGLGLTRNLAQINGVIFLIEDTMICVRGMVEVTCIWIMFQYTTLWRNWNISLIWNTSQWPKSLNWKPQKKRFFFLKRSYKIIPFNNNNAICQRNIIEQLSNMNFQFPGCSVFWDRGFKHRLNEVASISLVLNGYALCVYNNLYS